MKNPEINTPSLKGKIFSAMTRYWVYVVYLALVFAAFTQYRRFILADVGIVYTEYGVALIKALVFAKVIMVGDALKLAHGLDDKPLIIPTLIKTVAFTVLVSIFTFIEHAARGLWNGTGLMDGLMDFLDKGYQEVVANALVVFVAFIPFFALRELNRVLGGEAKLMALFFKRKDRHQVD
jgi:hypothetical protein